MIPDRTQTLLSTHPFFAWTCFVFLGTAASLFAQGSPSENPAATPSAATPVALSGREGQPGTVQASESTAGGVSGEGAVVIRGTVSTQGAYAGSVPAGQNIGAVLPLRLSYALELALKNNLGAISETQAVEQAEGLRQVARGALLPNVDSVVSETVEQLNLRTLGVETSAFPAVVGPFNFFDARAARLNQAVLDFVRWANLRAATHTVDAARLASMNARDLVALAVAGSYLEIIATNARIVAARAQVRSSDAIYKQAVDRLKEGLDARIDTTRAQVQLQIDQLRLRSMVAERDREKLRLARLIGLPLGQDFSLADDFPYVRWSGLSVSDALARAYRTRADFQSAQAAVAAARDALRAAHAERLPNLSLMADYGVAGLRPTASAHGVFTVSGVLTIPIYHARTGGDIEQAEAAVHQRQAELEDTRGQIDQDVRLAFIDLNAAADQVQVARSNVELAEDTLRQSRDRFADGVADTVEVVQAQQAVSAAHDDYISASFDYNLAKVSLARAMGNAERGVQDLLAGK